MPSRLQSVLDDLREATGATAADLTADEIESLVLACRRVDNPYAGVNADLMGRPVRVSRGVYLWPVTAGAQVWLTEFASAWWPRSSPMFAWARVHALAHARDGECRGGFSRRWRDESGICRAGGAGRGEPGNPKEGERQ